MKMRLKNDNEAELYPSVKNICIFLSDYAALLLGSGAIGLRIEKNVRRMAEAFNVIFAITILPSHIQLTVWDKEYDTSYNIIKEVYKLGINFNVNTLLSKLSWAVADGKTNFYEAFTELERIKSMSKTNAGVILLLVSFANMSFCFLFGGDMVAMLIVFIATLVGFKIKQILMEEKVDIRLSFVCSSFISSIISAGGCLFNLGNTPEIALGTSVLYLVPGIPYINTVSDMLGGHYICAFCRFIDATILTICLSIGFCGGLLLMDLKWF